MSSLWFIGHADPSETGHWHSPDPVTAGDAHWTWDIEFTTSNSQWTYARSSVNSFALIDGDTAWIFSGIVAYRTRSSHGVDTVHKVGASGPDGVVDFMNDHGVDSVTFGWGIGGDTDYFSANVNFEVWVS
jgi:hypothetical protein